MRRLLLGLSLAQGVGWKTIDKLVLQGIDETVYGWRAERWKREYPFLSQQQSEQLAHWMQRHMLVDFAHKLDQKGIGFVSVEDEQYPKLLKEMSEPPWVLYYKGTYELIHTPSIAVVGSRKTSSYGRMATEKLVSHLSGEGWTVTSGLATGIDTYAHQAALRGPGKTIAVLGSGIDVIYPRQNRYLYQQIENSGLIISEYPPHTKAHPAFFPQRNRIIAGLTLGTLVIEAAKKSGSLITAHLALENGREVFAVPGSIFDQQSVGTNVLIQQHGAKLITNAQDILTEFEHLDLQLQHPRKELYQQEKGLPTKEMVNDKEREIVALLQTEKLHINDISSITKTNLSETSKRLLQLELKGLIKALPGSYYQLDRIDP